MSTEVNEAKNSRSLLTLGHDTMKKMSGKSVLISFGEFSGLATEVAKSVVMTGVKSLLLHSNSTFDEDHIETDLSTSYYLKPGKEYTRCKDRLGEIAVKLQELNPNVKIEYNALYGSIYEEIPKHDVVVCCDKAIAACIHINKKVREHGGRFIMCSTKGLYGYVFSDFGDKFAVHDTNGENLKSGVLTGVTNRDGMNRKQDNPIIESIKKHNLAVGDKLVLRENGVDGTTKIVTHVYDSHHFALEGYESDVKNFINVEFEQVKEPINVTFKSLEDSMAELEFVPAGYDFELPTIIHRFNNIAEFDGDLLDESPWTESYALRMIRLYRRFYPLSVEHEDTIRKLSYTCMAKIQGMDSVVGSIASFEVIKACSGKYTPMKQWLYFNALSCFPKTELPCVDNSNYLYNYGEFKDKDMQRQKGPISVFGRELVRKVRDSKIFIVGSGAIGCEHLKNFAMMGVGNMVITDMDSIELSNLTRQFFFRNSDVGQSKSVTAAREAMKINPNVRVVSHKNKVTSSTLDIYDKKFFDGLSLVTTAVDNIEARKFVDQQCVKHHKVLVDSGTKGTKGNVQVVLPNLTKCYSDSTDPPDDSVLACTLKFYPYLFQHTVQYSRHMLEEYINDAPSNYSYVKDNLLTLSEKTSTDLFELRKNVRMFVNNAPGGYFDKCIEFAYNVWHEKYRDNIYNLTQKHPKDKIVDGIPFWSQEKRFPSYFDFDINNEHHFNFVKYLAFVWATAHGDTSGVTGNEDDTYFKKVIGKLTPPPIKKSDVESNVTSSENDNENEKDVVAELTKLVKEYDLNPIVVEFEKDDDSNHHIDFISAASNMRAMNYGIKTMDRLATKQIAGKIIPAIISTTSLVSGLVSLEVYKVIQGENKESLDSFLDASCNLATNLYSFYEPDEVRSDMINDKKYNIWSTDKIDGDIKLRDLVDKYKWSTLKHKQYGELPLDVICISYGACSIYDINTEYECPEDLDKSVKDIIRYFNPDLCDDVQSQRIFVSLGLMDEETDSDSESDSDSDSNSDSDCEPNSKNDKITKVVHANVENKLVRPDDLDDIININDIPVIVKM